MTVMRPDGPGSDATATAPDAERGRARWPWALVIAAVAVPILAAVVLALLFHAAARRDAGSLAVAEAIATPIREDRPAPAFDLPDLAGTGRVSSSAFAGHVSVLNLWASWCGPCQGEAAALRTAFDVERARGVRFVGVDHMDTRRDAVAFATRERLPYALAFDPEGSVAARFGALGIPTTYVIAADGRIAYRFLGRVDAPGLERAVDTTLRAAP